MTSLPFCLTTVTPDPPIQAPPAPLYPVLHSGLAPGGASPLLGEVGNVPKQRHVSRPVPTQCLPAWFARLGVSIESQASHDAVEFNTHALY